MKPIKSSGNRNSWNGLKNEDFVGLIEAIRMTRTLIVETKVKPIDSK